MSDLFIVDNDDRNWKAKNYLHEWADLAHTFDVASGYFEIGVLLAALGEMAQTMATIDEVIEAHSGWPLTGNTGYPTVSQDTRWVRTMIMATHTKEELGYALEVFGQVGKDLGLAEQGSRK